jgi:hypothetical protein
LTVSIQSFALPLQMNEVMVKCDAKPDGPHGEEDECQRYDRLALIRVEANFSRDHCVELANAQLSFALDLVVRDSEHPRSPPSCIMFPDGYREWLLVFCPVIA